MAFVSKGKIGALPQTYIYLNYQKLISSTCGKLKHYIHGPTLRGKIPALLTFIKLNQAKNTHQKFVCDQYSM